MKIKHIRGSIQEMAQADVLDMIGLNRYESIKALDPSPMIRVYAVGHEGTSEGRIIGVGKVVQKWTRSIVERLGEMIEKGVGLFKGHELTNKTEGRRVLGEVVGTKVVEEDGLSKVLVAAWVHPSAKDEAADLDVCSVECDIDFTLKEGEATVVDVLPVTGIALGNSSEGMVPGFPF